MDAELTRNVHRVSKVQAKLPTLVVSDSEDLVAFRIGGCRLPLLKWIFLLIQPCHQVTSKMIYHQGASLSEHALLI